MGDFLAVLAVFGSIAYITRNFFDFLLKRNLINKGLIDDKIKHLFAPQLPIQRPPHTLSALKWGLVLIGIGAGLFIGMQVGYGRREEFYATMVFSSIAVCAGAGLILYYLIATVFYKNNKSNGE